MRVVTPLLTQTSGTVRVPALATLEQGLLPGEVSTPAGAPPGFNNWEDIISKTSASIAKEPTQSGKAVLSTALSVAAAAAPIPVAGWVVAAAGAALTLFGLTIRGKTQHVDAATAGQKAVEFVETTLLPIWAALPADARQKFFELTVAFDSYMWGTFKDWWGGRLQIDRTPFQIFPVSFYTSMTDAQMRDYLQTGYNIYAFYLYELMHEADADTVNDNLKPWYFDQLSRIVLRPLDSFMRDKYNSTLAQYTAAHGPSPVYPISSPIGATIGWILGLGVAGAVVAKLARAR